MIKSLFEKQRDNLNHFFEQIDLAAVEQLFDKLKACKGMIILTGVGKSGLVAEKIASTMTSTGTRAFYLDPTNALHGDIGIITKEDVFLIISKSGESDELLNLIPSVKSRGVDPIAIVNKSHSRLSKACSLAITLPMGQELCPFDIVPTTSAATQLLFGDVLAIALLQHKNFSLNEYALNHPGGKIGRKLTLRVSDLMLKGSDLPICRSTDKLVDILVELSNKKCGCIMITDEKKHLLGIFTDGDLRRALQKHGSGALEMSMEGLMTPTARTIRSDAMANQALALMESDVKRPVTVLPVLEEDNRVIGLIKMHDIVQSGL